MAKTLEHKSTDQIRLTVQGLIYWQLGLVFLCILFLDPSPPASGLKGHWRMFSLNKFIGLVGVIAYHQVWHFVLARIESKQTFLSLYKLNLALLVGLVVAAAALVVLR